MTILGILHKLILGPIELLLDIIFSLSLQMTGNHFLSIVALSLLINLLVLPLYLKADAIQEEERKTAEKLKPRVDRIKAAFSGDERFMILQTYYRQNHYKPHYVLRGSLSLLLQIPFFMAAYNFLSGLNAIQGISFGPIANLGAPDGMLRIGGMTLNLLPILMTAINIVSGIVYTSKRSVSIRDKIQMYGLAVLFLVLLYDSPAGLVIYWTLNNVFSLCKNIINKIRQPRKVVFTACSVIGIALGLLILIRFKQFGTRKAIWGIIGAIGLQLPLLISKIRAKRPEKNNRAFGPVNSKHSQAIFLLSCVLLTIITGLLIPSAVIHASPAEFIETKAFSSPLEYVGHAFLLAAGTFLIWCGIFYALSPEKKRPLISFVFAVISTIAIIDYMFFGNGYGNMSSLLIYDTPIWENIHITNMVLNGCIILAAAAILWVLSRKKEEAVKYICLIECLAMTGMSVANLISTQQQMPEIERVVSQQNSIDEKVIHLDKNGKNVIVFMLDRAVGYLVPFIMAEKPELREQFAGFTYYPNTLSYGHSTNSGVPTLFGGYEYTPKKMNERTNVLLRDKHNEALRVMPVIFAENGYEVTVCDPPYANYQFVPDLSIYDDYPEIRRFNTEGQFDDEREESIEERKSIRKRNLFCYSLYRISPVLIQSELYDDGNYNKTDRLTGDRGEYNLFMKSYNVMNSLSKTTLIQETGKNTFLMIANQMTHEATILQKPEYEPTFQDVNNIEFEREHSTLTAEDGRVFSIKNSWQRKCYDVNMAAFLLMGKWMDFLREEGVYDNTRIIIAADHGTHLDVPGFVAENLESAVGSAYRDIMYFNPLYIVKDFGSNEPFRTSEEFMTHADTPTIAFSGLIDQPVNPATNQVITDKDKQKDVQIVCSTEWSLAGNHGYTYKDPHMYAVKTDDILNIENWTEIK